MTKNVKIVVGLIAAAILLYAGYAIWGSSDSYEENRIDYERGYNWPSAVGYDLASIDLDARIKCHKMGLDQDACPQSDEDTTRRVMATLMTQTIEKNGPAWQGNAYLPDTIRAMNHRFYDLTHHFQENPCGPIPYGYANDQIMEQLREGEFIYGCGQGWSITTEWLTALEEESDTNTGSEVLGTPVFAPQAGNELDPKPFNTVGIKEMWESYQPQNLASGDRFKNRWVKVKLDWKPSAATADGTLVFRRPSPPNTVEMRFNYVEHSDHLRDHAGDGNEPNVICKVSGVDITGVKLTLNYCRIENWRVRQSPTSVAEVVIPVEVSGTPVFMPALTRDAYEVSRASEEHSRLLTSLPPTPKPTPTLTAEQLRGQLHISTTMPTAQSTPKALQGAVYESCEEADAAGEQRFRGVRGKEKGFPEEMIPSAQDKDGDGIVCEN